MHLAAILGLCLLTDSSVVMAGASPAGILVLIQQGQSDAPQASSPQEPVTNSQPTSPSQEASEPGQGTGDEQTGSVKATPQQPTSETHEAKPTKPSQSDATAKKPATKKRRRKPPVAASNSTSEKKVVKNGGAADPEAQLSPSVSNEQASRERESTTQLLANSDANLKQLAARQLSTTQQASVSQIRKYMEQAKAADAEGDVQRAQNLASKALMLSDDLVKH